MCQLTSSVLPVSVDVILELYSHLSLCRLVLDVWVFEQLVCVGTLGVVLHQTCLLKTVELLRPEQTIPYSLLKATSLLKLSLKLGFIWPFYITNNITFQIYILNYSCWVRETRIKANNCQWLIKYILYDFLDYICTTEEIAALIGYNVEKKEKKQLNKQTTIVRTINVTFALLLWKGYNKWIWQGNN